MRPPGTVRFAKRAPRPRGLISLEVKLAHLSRLSLNNPIAFRSRALTFAGFSAPHSPAGHLVPPSRTVWYGNSARELGAEPADTEVLISDGVGTNRSLEDFSEDRRHGLSAVDGDAFFEIAIKIRNGRCINSRANLLEDPSSIIAPALKGKLPRSGRATHWGVKGRAAMELLETI